MTSGIPPDQILRLPAIEIDKKAFDATGLAAWAAEEHNGPKGLLHLEGDNQEKRIRYIAPHNVHWYQRLFAIIGILGYGLSDVVSELKNVALPIENAKTIQQRFVAKINSYNAHLITYLRRPIVVEKVFRKKIFYFPTPEEARDMPLRALHRTWRINSQILLGLLASKEIESLGFHGTSQEGLDGIVRSRKPLGGYLWVAGINQRLDPITRLADFHTILYKSLCYSRENGGVFVLKTQDGQGIRKFIHTDKFANLILDFDSEQDRRLVDLIRRNRFGERSEDVPNSHCVGGAIFQATDYGSPIPIRTKNVFTADEYHVYFDSGSYSKVVRGIVPFQEMVIPYDRPFQILPLQDGRLAFKTIEVVCRLSEQEILLRTFLPSARLTQKEVQQLRLTGKQLLKRADEITRISPAQLIKMSLSTNH